MTIHICIPNIFIYITIVYTIKNKPYICVADENKWSIDLSLKDGLNLGIHIYS